MQDVLFTSDVPFAAQEVALQPRFFRIQAEYLHLYVGRRAAVLNDESNNKVPFVVDAVTHRPETGLIEVDAFILPNIVGLTFGADTIVEVQHAA